MTAGEYVGYGDIDVRYQRPLSAHGCVGHVLNRVPVYLLKPRNNVEWCNLWTVRRAAFGNLWC